MPNFQETDKRNTAVGDRVLLSIAGYDPSGGGGVLADLRAARFCGVRAVAAVTAVTAQNTREMTLVQPVKPDTLRAQLELLRADFTVGAIKIGMLAQAGIIGVVADFLQSLTASVPVVLDPVLRASAGMALLDAPLSSLERLWPYCTLVTPNLPELASLCGLPESAAAADRESAVSRLLHRGVRAVLVKGGHAPGDVVTDTLHRPGLPVQAFSSPRRDVGGIRGTGCFLSSAIAAYLMRGCPLEDAVRDARRLLLQRAASAWRPSRAAGALFADFAYDESERKDRI